MLAAAVVSVAAVAAAFVGVPAASAGVVPAVAFVGAAGAAGVASEEVLAAAFAAGRGGGDSVAAGGAAAMADKQRMRTPVWVTGFCLLGVGSVQLGTAARSTIPPPRACLHLYPTVPCRIPWWSRAPVKSNGRPGSFPHYQLWMTTGTVLALWDNDTHRSRHPVYAVRDF